MAGILDGEGTLAYDQAAVTMTCEKTIRWLAQFGGQVRKLPLRSGPAGQPYLQQWKWTLTGIANVRLMLQAVLPAMVTKSETAREILARIELLPGSTMPYRQPASVASLAPA